MTTMKESITLVGYGSQARAWAGNLRDRGRDLRVALRTGSPREAEVRAAGFGVVDLDTAPVDTPLVALLAPDETHPAIVGRLRDRMRPGQALVFAHGFNVRFGRLAIPDAIDVILVAPKGVGPAVRQLFIEGRGVACLIGVHQDPSGRAWDRAHELAADLGGERAGIYRASFAEETEADLFSEQVVLIGGVPALVQAAFETLVAHGVSEEVAYFECLHELKLITDLMVERGIDGMFQKISNTAKYGGLTVGSRLVGPDLRLRLDEVLEEIVSGAFARRFQEEVEGGFPTVHRELELLGGSGLARVGRRVRARMEGGDGEDG